MSDSRVYVGGLPNDIEERDIEKFFDEYGRINEILIRRGFAFVQFDDRRDAEDAIYDLNNRKLLGRRVTVEKARGKPKGRNQWPSSRKIDRPRRPYGAPIRTEFKLMVKNLSSKVSWQDLKDYMREAGEVTYGDAHRPYRNEGLVEFATYADMKAAIRKFDGTLFKGEKIRLIEAMKSGGDRYGNSRSRACSTSTSRSRSRSRSCGRSRSRSRAYSTSRSRSCSRSRSRNRARTTSRSSSRGRNFERKSRSRSHSRSIEDGRRTARSSRSRSQSKCVEMNRKYFKSRSESNSPHRKSQTTNSGPKTPPPAGLEPHGRSDSPRKNHEYRSRSNYHQDASVDRQSSRSLSRLNSPDSRSGSPNKSRKRSRSTSPSEIPAKRLK